MKDNYIVLRSPVITEKMTMMAESGNKVAFWVDPRANKSEIKKAIEKLFTVKVLGVNTQRVPGKKKRMGRIMGKLPIRKKAYITLKEGDKIPIFEGV